MHCPDVDSSAKVKPALQARLTTSLKQLILLEEQLTQDPEFT